MRLTYDLTLEQTQKLIMTPELRQAIELLQLNALELREYIDKELEENPLLEITNNAEEYESIDKYANNDVDWKEYFDKFDDISYRPQTDENIKEYNYESFISYEPTLKEHLFSQLNLMSLENIGHKIGVSIIENIDNSGYLTVTAEEISKYTKSTVEEVEIILNIIQNFEPLGVGARDLKECLLIQTREKKGICKCTVNIIEDYLEDVGQNRIQKIAKELNVEPQEIQEACDYIKSLEPKPGRTFGSNDDIKYIKPDVEIKIVDGEFEVIVNDVTGPRLNINNYYKNLLRTSNDKNTMEFLNEKFNSAMWIIRSIEQRRNTIKRVVESIIRFQKDFFLTGEKSLRPLTLKEVADDIDMHESTISRATNGKFAQTPRGIFELKYFFSSSLDSDKGGISSTSIKSHIKEILDEEDPKKPYSDSKLAEILGKQGISISRRTIAKYRDELNIPSSNIRRRY
ncbi:MAG: RNA polymerase factor sigma-54 [Tissierellaceae bacterium]|nr:RNA polymerase factor sigma-54 [Tissierellaceae bacterium]